MSTTTRATTSAHLRPYPPPAASDAESPPPRDTASTAGELAAAAADTGADLERCLQLARDWGSAVPFPGEGDTRRRWALLSSAASGDLTAARVLEPHLDALAILREAGSSTPDGVWGVFAAEAPGAVLTARHGARGWMLHGEKPWCSLGGRLDRALVTAHTGDERTLFAVDLHHPGVQAIPGTWIARGLQAVDSGPVRFDAVPAEPVGDPGWYLTRPGFAWGGIGVAACWVGGARALVDAMAQSLRRALAGRGPDAVRALNLGSADAALFAADACLDAAAARVDAGQATGDAGTLLAARVRAVAHAAAEHILRHAGHALGPAPLAFDETHARRVADLQLYLRQHHGERDLSALGTQILLDGATP